MKIVKVCMECGHEFEDDIEFDYTLSCPKCGNGDIYQPTKFDYSDISPEECFIIYHENKIACICNADEKELCLVEE